MRSPFVSPSRFVSPPLLPSFLLGLVLAALLVACGEPAEPPPVAAPVEPEPISGLYDVKGVTVPVEGGGEGRRIAGVVILKQQGASYTATFKLDTTFPGVEDPVQADVIGSGKGTVEGRSLTGTARTQLVVSTVPGIDTDFAFIPRIVGARIVSTAITEIHPDGSLVIELENMPAEGEDYRPTRTKLTGQRVADTSAVGRIPTPGDSSGSD
jgi:hypothetical protein